MLGKVVAVATLVTAISLPATAQQQPACAQRGDVLNTCRRNTPKRLSRSGSPTTAVWSRFCRARPDRAGRSSSRCRTDRLVWSRQAKTGKKSRTSPRQTSRAPVTPETNDRRASARPSSTSVTRRRSRALCPTPSPGPGLPGQSLAGTPSPH